MTSTYFGKVCAKHPELAGERRSDARNCIKCAQEASKKWKLDNSERVKARRKLSHARYKEASPEKIAESNRKYYSKNPEKFAESVVRRKRLVSNQMPKWANREVITEIYRKARATGNTVDHIVPLRGKTVSGLHVENNLQIISLSENSRKGNTFNDGTIASAMESMGGRV